ncbi:hypothetical protein [Paenibacillus glacialis]|nr:hypothetical protein [Paenibacillus glacialis]
MPNHKHAESNKQVETAAISFSKELMLPMLAILRITLRHSFQRKYKE